MLAFSVYEIDPCFKTDGQDCFSSTYEKSESSTYVKNRHIQHEFCNEIINKIVALSTENYPSKKLKV